MSQKVIVVGSLSMDLVLTVPRLPLVGETIKGDSFSNFVGGKGNNQALAAAKLGASVSMLGLLGKDNYGDIVLGNLQQNNVDCRHMLRTDKTGTGIANIWVGPAGENVIVIIPNANGALSPQLVEENKAIFDDAAVLLLQLEIPLETVTRAAHLARECGVKVILNPAPAPADGKLPAELLGCVDIIVPNETEAMLITGINPDTEENALRCAEKLLAMGPGTVVLTLGARGALIVEQSGNHQFISSFQVKVVDSTAAGDAFLGAMAAGLADNLTAGQAVKQGCAAGALACTRAGAAPSLPSKEALSTLLENATG
ncbi:MAG: ribokinase [Candidatus Obscuribacter sp.]|nr:ribokinase [Candidatus Obscuribacter sp.]MBK9282171.1 ribokinase [Candidatus Obscuribacter sp.]